MVVAYWVLAGLLALVYLYSGILKTTRSREALLPMMGWVATTPMGLLRALGAVELAGVVGLVLPPLTGIAAGLALAAAVGFVLVQVGAIAVHGRRGELSTVGFNVGLLVTAGVLVWLSTTWL